MLRSLLVAVVLTLTVAADAHATLPQQAGAVALPAEASARLDGGAANELVGSAAVAGDVNGDGIVDSAVGAQNAAGGAGQVLVSFGGPAFLPPSFAAVGTDGFLVTGAPGEKAGVAVSGAGDVNGDGLDDIVIGTSGAGFSAPGKAYVVFGSASSAPVDVADLGTRGFEIDGATVGDLAGVAVSGAGDLDGDGLDDVVVGAPLASPLARSSAGEAWVVYGRTAVTPVDLAGPGTSASAIQGASSSAQTGTAVAGLGDTNGDGVDDVAVGAPNLKVGLNNGTGAAYVVFGSSGRSDVDLSTLTTTQGFKITGNSSSNMAGSALAGPGDVTGDGLADVLVAAPGVHPGSGPGNVNQGRAYVVPGSATPADINLGTGVGPGHAFRFDGSAAGDLVGAAVSAAGDVNSDGHLDVLVSATGVNGLRGAAYVVYGPITQDVGLPSLGSGGITIADPGAAVGAAIGSSVAGGGDLDGDGRDDVLVAENHADPSAGVNAGSVFAVRGFGVPALSYAQAATGTAGEPIAPVTPAVLERTGSAVFSAAGLPEGLTIDPATGAITGTPSAAASGAATVTMTDLVGTVDASVTFAIEAAAVVPPPPPPPPPPIPPLVPPTALTLTGVSIAPHCIGTGSRAASDLKLSYTLNGPARVTFTLQRRTSPGLVTPRRCPKALAASDKSVSYGDVGTAAADAPGGASYATVKQGGMTARVKGRASAARHAKPLARTLVVARGQHRFSLLRTLRATQKLEPGRYRILVDATRADGVRARPATVWFWVLRPPKR